MENKILINVELSKLLDSSSRFYLEDNFRNHIFSQLKLKYQDWRIVANKLKINTRNLFGIRRGFEFNQNKKKKYFLSSKCLKKIQIVCNLNIKEIEKHIEIIKLGTSGRQSYMSLPTSVQIDKEPFTSVQRVLAEYIYANSIEAALTFHKPNLSRNNNYFQFLLIVTKKKLESLRLRGLSPKLIEKGNLYLISYRNPGSNQFITRTIPKSIIFHEVFAKELGKWIGDRCGGKNKIGVANKNFNFITEFKNFLNIHLNQPTDQTSIELTHKEGFVPNQKLKSRANKIRLAKTQLGDYAFRIELSNKILKNLLFDIIEEDLFEILWHSPKSVRFAFYAGLFEAEGSICPKSKNLSFAFGLNLTKNNIDYLSLFYKVIKFKKLLKNDGFNPKISRKVANTKKSSILKYDVILLNSFKTRQKEITFIKQTLIPYITYKEKKEKILKLEETYGKT